MRSGQYALIAIRTIFCLNNTRWIFPGHDGGTYTIVLSSVVRSLYTEAHKRCSRDRTISKTRLCRIVDYCHIRHIFEYSQYRGAGDSMGRVSVNVGAMLRVDYDFADLTTSTPRVMSIDEMNKKDRNRILRTRLEAARIVSKMEPPGNRSHNHISGNKLSRAKNADTTPRTTKSALLQMGTVSFLSGKVSTNCTYLDQSHLVLIYGSYTM